MWGLGTDSVTVCWLPHFHDMGLVSGILLPLFGRYPAVLMAPTTFVQHPLRWLEAITSFRATHSGAPNFAYDLCVRSIPRVRGDRAGERELAPVAGGRAAGAWRAAR